MNQSREFVHACTELDLIKYTLSAEIEVAILEADFFGRSCIFSDFEMVELGLG